MRSIWEALREALWFKVIVAALLAAGAIWVLVGVFRAPPVDDEAPCTSPLSVLTGYC